MWTSGANQGAAIEVKTTSTPAPRFRSNSGVHGLRHCTGDTFTVTAGCDKSLDTCIAKFNNVANFRGFPLFRATTRSCPIPTRAIATMASLVSANVSRAAVIAERAHGSAPIGTRPRSRARAATPRLIRGVYRTFYGPKRSRSRLIRPIGRRTGQETLRDARAGTSPRSTRGRCATVRRSIGAT